MLINLIKKVRIVNIVTYGIAQHIVSCIKSKDSVHDKAQSLFFLDN